MPGPLFSVAGYLHTDSAKRILSDAAYKAEWDRWYASIPNDLRQRLSLHDFKRLGECFKTAFGIDTVADRSKALAYYLCRQDCPTNCGGQCAPSSRCFEQAREIMKLFAI